MKELFDQKNISRIVIILGGVLALFVFAKFCNEVRLSRTIGHVGGQTNTISVSANGEVYKTPDIASVSFSVRHTEKTVALAQAEVAKKIGEAFDFLEKNGIDKKDIQTTGTGFNPQYQYDGTVCQMGYCPPPKNPVITGYEMNESVTVKIRTIDSAGTIIAGLGNIGVTDLYGPNFSIENEDSARDQARALAITKAKSKAQTLARDLGVHLGDIVSFSDSGSSPMPMYLAKDTMAGGMGGGVENIPLAPGDNKITSNVTIVYEIR
jgi:uncharacterized protein